MDASPDHGVGCQIKILRTRSGMEHKRLLFPRQTFLAIGKEIVIFALAVVAMTIFTCMICDWKDLDSSYRLLVLTCLNRSLLRHLFFILNS